MDTRPGTLCSTIAAPVAPLPRTTLSTPAGKMSPARSGQHQGGFRGGVAGLEHDGVAGGEGGADLPDGHQERVVPRRHLGHDADRFAAHVGGVALEVLAGGLAFQDAGGAGEEAQLVRAGGHFLGGDQGADLAGVAVLGLDELVAAGLDGVGELEQHELALARGGVLPGLEGVLARRPWRRRRRPALEMGAWATTSPLVGLTMSSTPVPVPGDERRR